MRVWDVNPGYLNRNSLLAEHREIHGVYVVLAQGKRGYRYHPETLRWEGHLGALRLRHDLVVSEMLLRGYRHRSPMPVEPMPAWPDAFVDAPAGQFAILGEKYVEREPGRIPLPRGMAQLWAQHKYSALARDPESYRQIGRGIASGGGDLGFDGLALHLVEVQRARPPAGRLVNALQHMWGYVAAYAAQDPAPPLDDPEALIGAIRRLALQHQVTYLVESTALSDLASWISDSSAQVD